MSNRIGHEPEDSFSMRERAGAQIGNAQAEPDRELQRIHSSIQGLHNRLLKSEDRIDDIANRLLGSEPYQSEGGEKGIAPEPVRPELEALALDIEGLQSLVSRIEYGISRLERI